MRKVAGAIGDYLAQPEVAGMVVLRGADSAG
jgi:hypothetical protein